MSDDKYVHVYTCTFRSIEYGIDMTQKYYHERYETFIFLQEKCGLCTSYMVY